jgi:hypothetical protein
MERWKYNKSNLKQETLGKEGCLDICLGSYSQGDVCLHFFFLEA